jgi:hypothetical protein
VTGRGAVADLAVLLAGCGGDAGHADWARPQTLRLGGPEPCGPPGRAVSLSFRRLTLAANRWRVDASVRNGTGVPLGIVRPHTDETFFGLAVFRGMASAEVSERVRTRSIHVQLVADRFRPELPRQLAPGSGWSGTFSGPGRVSRGRVVRVVTGRFVIVGRPPRGLYRGFLCISEHGRRVR